VNERECVNEKKIARTIGAIEFLVLGPKKFHTVVCLCVC